VVLLFVGFGHAQEMPVDVPQGLPPDVASRFNAERQGLLEKLDVVKINMATHNKKCGSVVKDSAEDKECLKSRAVVEEQMREYSAGVRAFNRTVAQAITSSRDAAANENDLRDAAASGPRLGTIDPNSPQLGRGERPQARRRPPTEEEVIKSIIAQAKALGWSAEKLQRLDKALRNLDLDSSDYRVGTVAEVSQVWREVESRTPDRTFARDASLGHGPSLPPGRMQTEYNDCAIFSLANAARLPYGVVAARAAEIVRGAVYRSAGERANPQKAIEQGGLNGGEVIMLAESFGRAEVTPPAAFARTLMNGKPILVGLAYPTGNPKDPIDGHEVVLTKTFLHNGERWYEMMNSQDDPWKRQYVSEKELGILLLEKGVAYSRERGTVVKPLK
jgi:hypothetical protein